MKGREVYGTAFYGNQGTAEQYRRIISRRRAKAARIRRHRRITAVLAIAVSLVIAILCGSWLLKAEADHEQSSYKYFTEVRVGRDDSLWSIAQKYYCNEYDSLDAYIEEVCRINSLRDGTIYYGQYLMVPYYSDVLQ